MERDRRVAQVTPAHEKESLGERGFSFLDQLPSTSLAPRASGHQAFVTPHAKSRPPHGRPVPGIKDSHTSNHLL